MEILEKIMYIFSKFATRKCFYSMIFIVDQKCFPKLINVWYGISTYWVEFCWKINKHPQTLIRYSRVHSFNAEQAQIWKMFQWYLFQFQSTYIPIIFFCLVFWASWNKCANLVSIVTSFPEWIKEKTHPDNQEAIHLIGHIAINPPPSGSFNGPDFF